MDNECLKERVIKNKEKKFSMILKSYGEHKSENEFINIFRELYPNDFENIRKTITNMSAYKYLEVAYKEFSKTFKRIHNKVKFNIALSNTEKRFLIKTDITCFSREEINNGSNRITFEQFGRQDLGEFLVTYIQNANKISTVVNKQLLEPIINAVGKWNINNSTINGTIDITLCNEDFDKVIKKELTAKDILNLHWVLWSVSEKED